MSRERPGGEQNRGARRCQLECHQLARFLVFQNREQGLTGQHQDPVLFNSGAIQQAGLDRLLNVGVILARLLDRGADIGSTIAQAANEVNTSSLKTLPRRSN
jgi:hypothetical protein